ncbi:MAG: PD-(D/E)XK nuclease family protein [Tildeniella torsiva UHER 1998/13D]|jgi:hypothetical protein|nr:PD-(D/E)XK nuclease family protein [Tildeniella torsiva UHER 1998/13D]
MNYESLSEALARFRRIAFHEKCSPTFMEITSYPHLENVASNVLDFYFNPNAEHGLGALLLEALLSLVATPVTISNPQVVFVSREVITSSGKRIDLLIDAYPDAVIVIENKIFHTAINPFIDYEEHANKAASQRPIVLILLTLFDVPPGANIGNFKPVLYKSFCQEILNRIGSQIINADNRYLIFLLDFIQTTQNLYDARVMNQEFLTFLRSHEEDTISLLQKVTSLQKEMKKKAGTLAELMREKESDTVKLWFYSSGLRDKSLREAVGYWIPVSHDYGIGIVADLSIDGWDIRIKDDNFFKGVPKTPGYNGFDTQLSQWLQAKQIEVSPHPSLQGHFRYGSHFPYDSDLVLVDAEIKGLLALILKECL